MYASENSRIYHIFDSCHMSSGTKAAYQSKGPTHVYVVKFDFFPTPLTSLAFEVRTDEFSQVSNPQKYWNQTKTLMKITWKRLRFMEILVQQKPAGNLHWTTLSFRDNASAIFKTFNVSWLD